MCLDIMIRELDLCLSKREPTKLVSFLFIYFFRRQQLKWYRDVAGSGYSGQIIQRHFMVKLLHEIPKILQPYCIYLCSCEIVLVVTKALPIHLTVHASRTCNSSSAFYFDFHKFQQFYWKEEMSVQGCGWLDAIFMQWLFPVRIRNCLSD